MRKHKKLWITLISVTSVLLILFICFAVYIGDYYRADDIAVDAMQNDESIQVIQTDDGNLVFMPEKPTAAFIFYPGGKVEYIAYSILMRELAEHGVLCVLVKMPFNLAVLDMNAADGVCEQYLDISKWYIGGHSLGGAMAASYAAEHTDDFDGLILLAAYSTADLQASNLQVLSLYGSEDRVMNREKYDKYKSNLPDSTYEKIIDGGCHAYFGCYGMQDGDGTPTISNDEQITETVEFIIQNISK